MSKTAKREYLLQKSIEYKRCVRRTHKHALIEEAARTCGFSVKYVIRRLNAPLSVPKKPRKRRLVYTRKDAEWLKRIWRESDFLCGKLLAGIIPQMIQSVELENIAVPEKTRERLLKISPATIDRLLRDSKLERPKRHCASALSELRKEIPVRALRASHCSEPGHFGADTVALGGGATRGEFFWILTLTDVFSGYTLIYPVWNKTAQNLDEALKKLLEKLPFETMRSKHNV